MIICLTCMRLLAINDCRQASPCFGSSPAALIPMSVFSPPSTKPQATYIINWPQLPLLLPLQFNLYHLPHRYPSLPYPHYYYCSGIIRLACQFAITNFPTSPPRQSPGKFSYSFAILVAMVKVAEMGSAVAALPNSAERLRQRYDNHLRLVAGCVPYKLKPNTEEGAHDNLEDRLQVLMVSSPNRDDLVFPKGGWENGETEREAACREAFEEAGIKGTIHGTLGVWEFRSKSSQKNCSLEGSCRGSMFAFEVTDELTSWPEEAIHQRRWLKVEDAFRLCRYDWMREALSHCLIFLSSEHPSSPVPEVKEASVPANSKRVESPILYVDSSCQLVHNSSGFGTTVYK